jgi:hypothetical protein
MPKQPQTFRPDGDAKAMVVTNCEVGWSKSGLVLLRLEDRQILAFSPDLARELARGFIEKADLIKSGRG